MKYGYNEWQHLLEFLNKHKGKYAEELRLVLETFTKKVKGLDLVPKTSTKRSLSSTAASVPMKRTSNSLKFLLSYGTTVINKSLPVAGDHVQHIFIHQSGHEIFYMD